MKTDITYCFGNSETKHSHCMRCQRFITEVPHNITLSVVEMDEVPCPLFMRN